MVHAPQLPRIGVGIYEQETLDAVQTVAWCGVGNLARSAARLISMSHHRPYDVHCRRLCCPTQTCEHRHVLQLHTEQSKT